jgi:maltose/maltodextrin transport system permease protein
MMPPAVMPSTRTRPTPCLALRLLPTVLGGGTFLAALAAVMHVHAAGQPLLAVTLLVLACAALWAGTLARHTAWPYLLPGLAAAAVFVVFPMAYTVAIGFTNTSSSNLLPREEVRTLLLQQRTVLPDSARTFTLHAEASGRVRVRLAPDLQTAALDPSDPAPGARLQARLETVAEAAAAAGPALELREHVVRLPALRALVLTAPDGRAYELLGLREFAQLLPQYREEADGALVDIATGQAYRADETSGFYTAANGERLQPGFRVQVGWRHYARLLTEETFRAPFLRVFAWTVAFAALSVAGAAGLGMLLAGLMNWPALRGKAFYRTVLFLPYAVPGFISILVFKGLFNQNLGEVNLILHTLFGIRPAWFSDPWLAKLMLLIVNVWLGFPYMMVLCTGLIQAIPADLYEASAVAGAGPWANFRRITAPLIARPLTPLLISAFAFNFNNFVLISLLTGGRPDQLDSVIPAGTTDLLVSYTWRIAFQDSGQQFGLAAAISTVIFLLVAALALLQMRFTRVAAVEAGR